MRLWFSVAVLLILTCVVLEISAAKSNRDTEIKKGNHESRNSKEVRYSKNKSDLKKKGNGKKQEIVKGKEPRRNLEGKENVDSIKVAKKNKNERNGKISQEGQQRQQSDKLNKVDKNNGENFKNNRNIKEMKGTVKKQKRSVESEQFEQSSSNNGATDYSPKNEESQINSASKKVHKNKFDKKSKRSVEKALEQEPEGEMIVNIGKLSDDQQSEDTASSLDKVKSSRKNEIGEEHGKSKKIKQQKYQNHKSEGSSEENKDLKKSKLKKKEISVSDEPNEPIEESESSNDSVEEKCENVKTKKHQSSKKLSKCKSECECQVKDCELSNLDPQEQIMKRSEKYKPENVKLESQDLSDKNRTHAEESEYTVEELRRTADIVENESQFETENKVDSKNMHLMVTEEDEIQYSSSEAKNCLRAAIDVQDDHIMQETCSTE